MTCQASDPSDGRSTSRSRCAPTAPTGTPTPTSTSPPTASTSATPGSCGARRAPARTTWAPWARSPAATSWRSAAGPGSARAGCSAHGGRPVGIDVSMRQLQHSRRIDDEHRVVVPLVCASAAALPFPDDSFDVVFSAFGALQFVADAEALVVGRRAGAAPRRLVRVLRSRTRPAGCSRTTRARRG